MRPGILIEVPLYSGSNATWPPSFSSREGVVRERDLYQQPTGPSPPNHRNYSSRPALRHGSLSSLFQVALHLERLVIYCQTTGVSTAHATHCATYCTPCRPLIRAFPGWIRTPPPTCRSEFMKRILNPSEYASNLGTSPSFLGTVPRSEHRRYTQAFATILFFSNG